MSCFENNAFAINLARVKKKMCDVCWAYDEVMNRSSNRRMKYRAIASSEWPFFGFWCFSLIFFQLSFLVIALCTHIAMQLNMNPKMLSYCIFIFAHQKHQKYCVGGRKSANFNILDLKIHEPTTDTDISLKHLWGQTFNDVTSWSNYRRE